MDPVCEPEAAIQRLGGDVQLYRELVQSFVEDSAGLVPQIMAALAAKDFEKLHRAAHCLKGTAATCGALAVASACAQIEQSALDKELEHSEQHFGELRLRFREAASQLANFYSSRKEDDHPD
jgi:two-component system, sensor histidine kinase and response regulator